MRKNAKNHYPLQTFEEKKAISCLDIFIALHTRPVNYCEGSALVVMAMERIRTTALNGVKTSDDVT